MQIGCQPSPNESGQGAHAILPVAHANLPGQASSGACPMQTLHCISRCYCPVQRCIRQCDKCFTHVFVEPVTKSHMYRYRSVSRAKQSALHTSLLLLLMPAVAITPAVRCTTGKALPCLTNINAVPKRILERTVVPPECILRMRIPRNML